MPYGFAQRDTDIENFFRIELRKESTAPIAWDNVDFEIPVQIPWVRFSIRPAVHGVDGLGSECHLDEGFIYVQCFAPTGEGAAELRELVDVVVKIFHGVRLGGTIFEDTSVRVLGARDSFFSHVVEVEYSSYWSEA